MNIIVFEDDFYHHLYPFTLTHATFEIRCGIFTHLERLQTLLSENDTLTLVVRPELKNITKERFPKYLVNPDIVESGFWLNGAVLWTKEMLANVMEKRSFSNNNRLVAFHSENDIPFNDVTITKEKSKLVTSQINVILFEYLWDAIFQTGSQIIEDVNNSYFGKQGIPHPSVILVNEEEIYLAEGCGIAAGVVLDATEGPIIIDENAFIDIGALIKGPVYIGKNSIVNPGCKLRRNITIGPYCKIGGEIEDTIFQGYSNKQHDGFLGHSYIGEWVNLGANTNNSDLKNNYSNIRFELNREIIETDHQFLGVMIGDYTKTGISTSFNTGTYCGVGANIFGSGFQNKTIPSFSWGSDGQKMDLEKFLDTCKIVKSRRDCQFSAEEKDFFIKIYHKS
ncbi:MAG: hypothetical protein ISR90_00820 [Candidatus Marinimicrobia bacterium]|nr:hypothetical protein [Candidatus Neomarinimicrobiota bacterium]MBL7022586.1 hypothetical protein [Candidatus Neomarinimicrobiota bacterium]MBL7108942.1 hypothetical protein [Candidatus Neomarinimicrobiota bacterium]